MFQHKSSFFLAMFLLGSSAASAVDYVSLHSGWTLLEDYQGASQAPVFLGTFEDGYLLGGAIGQRFYDRLRGEFEFTYRNNSAGDWLVNGNPGPWSGRLNSYASMFNLVTDCSNIGCVRPYVGGGLGVAVLEGEFETLVAQQAIEATVFAYQGFTGLSFNLSRELEFFTEYRFFGTTETDLVNTTTLNDDGDFAYLSHNVLMGLRFKF